MPRRLTEAEALTLIWSRVDRNGPTMPGMETPCWVWTGATDEKGYGRVGLQAFEEVRVTRIVWTAEVGPVPADLKVLHRCDNPPCVRPDHLFVGTQGDNVRDAVAKGRARSGAAKLTRKIVETCRARHAAGESGAALAREHGVDRTTMNNAIAGRTWRNLG